MTEREWLEADSPRPLLASLKDWASWRKLRLLACAYCRAALIADRRVQEAIEVAELFADDRCSEHDLACFNQAAAEYLVEVATEYDDYSGDAACLVTHGDPWEAVGGLLHQMAFRWRSNLPECRRIQAALVREIFGNPYRPVIANSEWVTPTVRSIADEIYETRSFDPMPVLADALEDAGCCEADVLHHCRQFQPHVRGCWVIDLLSGMD